MIGRWLALFLVFTLAPAPALAGVASCFKCHKRADFQKAVVHAPVKGGRCARCHSPHVSRYKNLLNRETPGLCFSCHSKEEDRLAGMGYVHTPVKKGQCLACHDPHSASRRNLLKKGMPSLCFSCHKKMARKFPRTHAPFARGQCLVCHNAHGGMDSSLARASDPAMCLRCHRDSPAARKAHLNMSLKRIKCLPCHSPHGSSRKALVRNELHAPFAEKACGDCHQGGQLKKRDLCFQCHDDREKDFYTLHNHLLVQSPNPCLDCHSPHASDFKNLLLRDERRLCWKCHKDTYKTYAESLYSHPQWGECSNCHNAHGSNQLAMMKGDGNGVCVKCHETQGKFTHPVGEKYRDPRTGEPVTCISCHDPMGAMFKFDLRLSGDKDLCIQCHKNY